MPLTAADVIPYLRACGYKLLRENFPLSADLSVPLVAFANVPEDARSACIAVLEKPKITPNDVAAVRELAAPIIFSCEDNGLQWWKQTQSLPEKVAALVPPASIPKFFAANKSEFEPTKIYRAKTWGRYDNEYQLWFVDRGLMPLVECEIGQRLVDLIVRNVDNLKTALHWKALNEAKSEWLLKAVFWLISAKILHDKSVGSFANIDLFDIDHVFDSVSKHFGTQGLEVTSENQRGGLHELVAEVARFSSLELATTEALAYVYENALISRATRKALGTHSTPAFLVDYIVGRLGKYIEAIEPAQRNVFEPACGHAAFLVSAMRYLTELLPEAQRANSPRRVYLRKRIHGIETDVFALEIARLSLSLTDIPNPNGWDLKPDDMFIGNNLETSARKATIFLANPPFENFTDEDRHWYASKGVRLELSSKVNEVFRRTLPELPAGAAIGLVAPQGILHSRDSNDLRRVILEGFDLTEICLFPDNVFQKSDSEPVIILGVKKKKRSQRNSLNYARVREHDYESFQTSYSTSFQQLVDQNFFLQRDSYDMRFAELNDVWAFCQNMPRIGTIVQMGKGLEFEGQQLPRGAKTYHQAKFDRAKPAFIQFDAKYIHGLPTQMWANLDSKVIRRPGVGTKVGVPQVLINYAPVSRGPWRLKALIDFEGHAVTSRFIAIRPLKDNLPLEFLWAMLNSPLANAFAYAHLTKRDVLVKEMKRLPIPAKWEQHEAIVRLVRRYFSLFSKRTPSLQTAHHCLLNIDAAVLALYDFPAPVERQLLDLFAGRKRPGVPFSMDEYIPKCFHEAISLRDYLYITEEWQDVNRRRYQLIRKKVKKTLTPRERPELSWLQQLAAFRQKLIAPLPIRELEQVSRLLVEQK